jgi:hypothetical protein
MVRKMDYNADFQGINQLTQHGTTMVIRSKTFFQIILA